MEHELQAPLEKRLTVACVRWGEAFGPEYVENMRRMVAKNLTQPHDFVCFTDKPEELSCDTIPLKYPECPGWWAKIQLFAGDVHNRILFFDLDTVIVGNIDFLARWYGDFTCLRGVYLPFRYGSGVMSIAGGFGRHAWTSFEKDRQFAMGFCGQLGDGHWMQLNFGEVPRLQDIFPGKFVSYKEHCKDGVPEGAAVVYFHGLPRPHQVEDAWVREVWAGEKASVAA